ncbi:uncharacterized protein [Amphiura filiformis]|uniref:uncharacterized protein n=1 Tax=Amphiura filiformis TaxID=82378 RepID=UPI003B21E44D
MPSQMDTTKRLLRISQLFYLILIQFTEIWNFAIASETRVVTRAPVSPVVEGEILSVHCQVWNLQKGQEVTFIRSPENGEQVRIAFIVDGEPLIVSNTGGTVFVAVRQMHSDGSVVYFLSILDAAKEDAGEYSCKINSVGNSEGVLPSDSVYINIAYFPSEPSPVCEHGELETLSAGDEMTLLCTSENAYPEVSIQWTRSGSSESLISEKISRDGRTGALLKRRVTEHDSGKIFLCQVTSRSFPSRTESCHVGPITVRPNGNAPAAAADTPNVKPKYGSTKSPSGLDVLTKHFDNKGQDSANFDKQKCWKTCSESSSVMYWILATAAASILALTFMILGIVMICKYYRIPENDSIPHGAQYIPTLHTGEEIYVEVESKRRDKSMYMSLEKPRKPEHLSFPTTGEM